MNVRELIGAEWPTAAEYFDVIVVGAGISGVGAAYHLTKQCAGKRFVVLEAMDSFGGTWRTHRYPGIRSDSDLHTFGYRFKPWTSAPIATGEEILRYLGEVIEKMRSPRTYAIGIRYCRLVGRAPRSSGGWTSSAPIPASCSP